MTFTGWHLYVTGVFIYFSYAPKYAHKSARPSLSCAIIYLAYFKTPGGSLPSFLIMNIFPRLSYTDIFHQVGPVRHRIVVISSYASKYATDLCISINPAFRCVVVYKMLRRAALARKSGWWMLATAAHLGQIIISIIDSHWTI